MSLVTPNYISNDPLECVGRERIEGERSTKNIHTDNARRDVFVSFFEDSAERFISTMEAISLLCGEQVEAHDLNELQRISQMITFLKEWRHFLYEPKTVNFVFEAGSQQLKEETGGIELPQFSSVAFPDRNQAASATKSVERKDFVLHAGGSVWGMDWCPRTAPALHGPARCEYLAVAAHPPGSSYHKIGACLTGRGIIQIWCILDINHKAGQHCQSSKERPRERCSRGSGGVSIGSKVPIKPRGRPRKSPFPVDDSNIVLKPRSSRNSGLSIMSEVPLKPRGRPRKSPLPVDDSYNVPKSKSPRNGGLSIMSEVPIKPRQRPRKSPLPVDVSNNLPISMSPMNSGLSIITEVPIKRRGRPRKRPLLVSNSNNGLKSNSPRNSGLSILSEVPIKPRGRQKKSPLPVDDSNNVPMPISPTNSGSSIMSEVPIKCRGRPRKRPLLVSNSNNGLKSNSPKKRGRPRKLPISAESFNDSIVGNDVVPSKTPKRLPREAPGNAETLEELAPDERHRNILEHVEQADHNKNQMDPGMNYCDAGKSFNGKTGSTPYKRRGKSRKNPASQDVVQDSKMKSSSEKKSQGKTRQIPNKKLNEDAPCALADFSTVECSSIPQIKNLIVESEPSPPKKDMDRSKHGTDESVSEGSAVKSVYLGQKELLLVANKSEVSCLTEDFTNASCAILKEYQTDDGILGTKVGNSEAFVSKENSGMYLPLSVIREEKIGRNAQAEASVSKELMDTDDISCLRTDKDVAFPRVVLCLGHNGKVAWDIKWRPFIKGDEIFRHRLGYLAAVLGNGSLEVWEIPSPSAIRNIYKSSFKEGTDPRFVKLHPVFRCSQVKSGNRQSIALTLEWSKSIPDLILAGCHDGTVAMWKFSPEDSVQDTRPLLCFTADNVPIRAISWAPGESYSQSSNVIVTAGHEGIKFWDIRDPYRPLWDFNPAQKIILSLDWLQHPSCLIFSFDDGTIKTLSLSKAACNVHVTGKPFEGAKHGAIHNYYRSHFAIWSIHVSPVTGVAAYCCADGSTFFFQITEKSVEKEKSQYRLPHYLCGSLQGTGPSSLTLSSPFPYTAIPELPRRVRGIPPHSSLRALEKGEKLGEDLENPEFDLPKKSRKPSKKSQKKIQGEVVSLVEEEKESLQVSVSLDEDFLVFPPKIVAMHRVRWNPNPGSERWLCSGGAAGIIRCQVIDLRDS